jgi:antitoxin ParD1/3/4
MPTRNVVLTPHDQALVRDGDYQSVGEVPRDALRPIEARETNRSARLAALREAAAIGFGAVDRGDYRDFDTFEDLERHVIDLTDASLTNGDIRW